MCCREKSSLNFTFGQGSCLISDFARPNSNKVSLVQVFLRFEIFLQPPSQRIFSLIRGRQKKKESWIFFFFSIWVFFHEHSQFTGQQGKWEGIYLTPLYHFHPLQRHLDISREISAESSPLHIASSRTRTGNLRFPIASRWTHWKFCAYHRIFGIRKGPEYLYRLFDVLTCEMIALQVQVVYIPQLFYNEDVNELNLCKM